MVVHGNHTKCIIHGETIGESLSVDRRRGGLVRKYLITNEEREGVVLAESLYFIIQGCSPTNIVAVHLQVFQGRSAFPLRPWLELHHIHPVKAQLQGWQGKTDSQEHRDEKRMRNRSSIYQANG